MCVGEKERKRTGRVRGEKVQDFNSITWIEKALASLKARLSSRDLGCAFSPPYILPYLFLLSLLEKK